MRKPSLHKRMYAVSKDGVGLIAGTLAHSRKSAIEHFLAGAATLNPNAWSNFKSTGYRTVMAQVKIIRRWPTEEVGGRT